MLAELLAWAALATWAWRGLGWAPWRAVALAMLGVLAVRLAIVAFSVSLSWLARSPRPAEMRLDLAGSLALVLGEWRTMIANNFLWIPFDGRIPRRDPPLAPGGPMPVIVVHGYFSNRGTVSALVRALDAAGAGPVLVPSFPAVVAPIETFTDHLARVVDDVLRETGHEKVILVCHSMGGLVARAYLATYGEAAVARLVTLGSPHQGTAIAGLGTGRNAAQMRQGSDFLRRLAEREAASPPAVPCLSVYSLHDNLVAPQHSSRLPWARQAAIHGVAHVAMLGDPRVHRLVLGEIAAARTTGS